MKDITRKILFAFLLLLLYASHGYAKSSRHPRSCGEITGVAIGSAVLGIFLLEYKR